MFTLRDPDTGKGTTVNDEGRAHVEAVNVSLEHYTNHYHGDAYQVPFAVNPDGGDDVIFYLKNNEDEDLVIPGFWYTSSAAEEIYLKIKDSGTAALTNGADMADYIVNLNAGESKAPSVTCYSNTGDGAVDITGLSGGKTLDKIWITAAADNKWYEFLFDIIVPKGQTFTIYCVGGDTNIRGTVPFYFHDKSD